MGKDQAATNTRLTCTPGGAWKPATLPQWITLGLKNGSKIITVIGSIDSTPSTGANAAPSLMPSQEGMKMTSSSPKQIRMVVTPIGAPQVLPTGSIRCPGLKL